jgi:hypothetical protein
MQRRKIVSQQEAARRAEQRKHSSLSASGRLLYDREQARFLLGGCSGAMLRRLEESGRLKPIKLTGSQAGKTFYSEQNIRDVAGGDSPQAEAN